MIKNKIKQNVYNISLSTIGHFIIDLYPAFIVGIIPLVAARFNLTIFHVSIMTAISQISNSITQPLFGYLSDKNGHKNYMVYGIFCAAIFLSLIAIAPNYFIILVLLFIGNLGVAAFHPPSAAIGAEYKGNKKGFGNSIIALGGNAGYAVGSLFFILIIDKIGINYSPFAMIPGVIIAIILLKPMSEYDRKRKNLKTVIKKEEYVKTNFKKIKIIHIFLVWVASLSRDILWIALLTFMPLHFTDLKINIINISIILLAFGVVGGIGGVFSSYFADRLKRNTLIQIAFAAIVPLVFFTFKTNNALSIFLFILTGFFLISTVPLCISMSHEIFPKNLSLASSLVMGFSAGFAGILVMFLGKLADKIGIEKTIYLILILPVIGFFAMFFLPHFEKKKMYN
ncbi:MAG: MFS transporter [Actinobacteria bacterium]|nr:MFS transporter [Actinomycetota bacterium]